MPADPHWQPFPPGLVNARIPIEGAAAMTSDPTPACVHDAADCRAQQCHAHTAPLVPRDVPHPANDVEYPPHEVTR